MSCLKGSSLLAFTVHYPCFVVLYHLILAIHNQYVMLMVDKLSLIESSLKSKQEPILRSASLDPRLVTLTKAERNLINDSLSRPALVCLDRSDQF